VSMRPPADANALATVGGSATSPSESSVDATSGQSQADQRLDLTAQLRPFEPWPVQSAQVKAQSLNLQRLLPTLPRTGLSGHVDVAPRDALLGAPGTRAEPGGRVQPPVSQASDLLVQVDLRNEQAGLWNAASVPVSAAKGRVTLPAQANMKSVGQLGRRGLVELALALPGQAGRERGDIALSGTWDLDHLEQTRLNAQLNGVDLRALDSRSPPLQLQGQVAVKGQVASDRPSCLADRWRARWSGASQRPGGATIHGRASGQGQVQGHRFCAAMADQPVGLEQWGCAGAGQRLVAVAARWWRTGMAR